MPKSRKDLLAWCRDADSVLGGSALASKGDKVPTMLQDLEANIRKLSEMTAIAEEHKAKRLAAVEQLRVACEANVKHKAEIVALSAENTRLRIRLQEAASRASKRARVQNRLLKACKRFYGRWKECQTGRVQ